MQVLAYILRITRLKLYCISDFPVLIYMLFISKSAVLVLLHFIFIQVTVKVCDAHGRVLPGVISIGAGTENTSEYQSLIYYHEDKPKWSETFKVDVPIEDFYNAHLRVSHLRRHSPGSRT